MIKDNHEKAIQYDKDLNKAKADIQKAQQEMKNIDSEVSDFQQRMAKSMHSLLKAFNDGVSIVDKAKQAKDTTAI